MVSSTSAIPSAHRAAPRARSSAPLLLTLLLACTAKAHPALRSSNDMTNKKGVSSMSLPSSSIPQEDTERHPTMVHSSASDAQRKLQSSADGYDVGGTAPICWKTSNIGLSTQTVDRLSSCPSSVVLAFGQTPPDPFFAQSEYDITYHFSINQTAIGEYAYSYGGTTYDIPHANIHSCVATVGFCTPFISNTPGLSTHTTALVGNVEQTITGEISAITFDSNVILNPGTYTIIAHVRFYAHESSATVKYDMATAIFRNVLPPRDIIVTAPKVQKAMTALIGLACSFLFINLCFLIFYRKHKVMRFSQVKILMGMTASGIVALAGVPLFTVNTDQSCLLRPWITIIPLNFMFGLLFGKTWRIWRLMNNKALKAMKIKESWVVLIATLITLPEILIHGIYFLISAPEDRLMTTLNDYTFVHICKGGPSANAFDGLHLVYGAMILLMGCFVANKSASLTTLFNEAKFILFAIYTCSLMALILVPASFVVKGDPSTTYILRAMGVSFSVCGTIGAINIPKIRLIQSGVEITTSDDNKKTVASPTTTSSKTIAGTTSGEPIAVKNHVPSAVYSKMETGLEALKKVVDRQMEGFAINKSDFDNCIKEINALNGELQRCNTSGAGDAGGGASAKVAPTAS